MGCDIPKVIDFWSLPVQVQDDLSLDACRDSPTRWPRYKISGYERVFHYRLMTVIRRAVLFEATCHTLTPGSDNNMYPASLDNQYRSVDQRVVACSRWSTHNPIRSKSWLFRLTSQRLPVGPPLFQGYGMGGILAKFIGRMNDPDIGGFEGFSLPQPVATWCQAFYDDYVTYLDIAGRDAVLAAQVASSGRQVTIQFIAVALEEVETAAQAKNQTLQEYLGSMTIRNLWSSSPVSRIIGGSPSMTSSWETMARSLLFVKCQSLPTIS